MQVDMGLDWFGEAVFMQADTRAAGIHAIRKKQLAFMQSDIMIADKHKNKLYMGTAGNNAVRYRDSWYSCSQNKNIWYSCSHLHV
jgi:hypothetical protein